jgi:D-alanyl-D-alanine dipeptidase
MSKLMFFALLFVLLACGGKPDSKSKNIDYNIEKPASMKGAHPIDTSKVDSKKRILIDSLVDIRSINPEIQVDLKYATSDNFMKMKLYDRLKNAYLQKDVAERLSNCQKLLSQIKSGYRLLVYDAVRPVSVQQKMWDALDSIPPNERGKFVSNPQNRSLHNLGAAVDLTIIDERGVPLDMGAGYDDIRKIAYPALEQEFLAKGELSEKQITNRELLRKVMKSQGFRPLETEWWHFNACSRQEGKAKYKVLMEEPK